MLLSQQPNTVTDSYSPVNHFLLLSPSLQLFKFPISNPYLQKQHTGNVSLINRVGLVAPLRITQNSHCTPTHPRSTLVASGSCCAICPLRPPYGHDAKLDICIAYDERPNCCGKVMTVVILEGREALETIYNSLKIEDSCGSLTFVMEHLGSLKHPRKHPQKRRRGTRG
jgi:hypothetical protein